MNQRVNVDPPGGRRPLDAGAVMCIERALRATVVRNELDRRSDGMRAAVEYLSALASYMRGAGEDASSLDDVMLQLVRAWRCGEPTPEPSESVNDGGRPSAWWRWWQRLGRRPPVR